MRRGSSRIRAPRRGRYGNSVQHAGDTNCAGGTCSHTGTLTGPDGKTASTSGNVAEDRHGASIRRRIGDGFERQHGRPFGVDQLRRLDVLALGHGDGVGWRDVNHSGTATRVAPGVVTTSTSVTGTHGNTVTSSGTVVATTGVVATGGTTVVVAPKPVVVAPPVVLRAAASGRGDACGCGGAEACSWSRRRLSTHRRPRRLPCMSLAGRVCSAGAASGRVGAGSLDRARLGAGALVLIGAAMRFKSRVTVEQGGDTVRRSSFDASSTRRFYQAGALAAMVVAAGVAIAMSRFVAPADTRGASGSSQECSARYAALLDLAELARRDGKSSEVVVRGLSDRGGAMSECFSVGGRANAD